MKHLVIIRHGEACRDDMTLNDIQYPLSRRGRRETTVAVSEFAVLGLQVDTVVSSPAKRALSTANIWLKKLNIPAERLRVDDAIYEAERSDIQNVIRQLDDVDDTVVLVGHNPGLTGTLNYLAGHDVRRMPVSAFAVISIDVDRWSQIALRYCEMTHYVTPPAGAPLNPLQRVGMWCRQRVQKVEIFIVVAMVMLVILLATGVAIYLNLRAA